MPDLTESVIIATFSLAMVAFVLGVLGQKLLKSPQRHREVAEQPPEIADLDVDLSHEAPHFSSLSRVPLCGKVSTWFYRPVDLLGLGLVFLLFFGLALTAVRNKGEEEFILTPGALVASIGFQFVCAGIVTSFVVGRIRPVEWLGLKWPAWPRVFLIAPGAVFLMWILIGGLQVAGLMNWIESMGIETVQDTVKLLQESHDPLILGLMAFAAVIAAPLCEEIVFRGYFYPLAKTFAGPLAATICSALVFGAAHGSLAALVPLTIFGILLVVLYEKTGSIWAPVAVHCCFNGATVLVQVMSRYYELPIQPTQ